MEFFWEMLSLQETMFLLILTGVLIKKLKITDGAGGKMLSGLLMDVILPAAEDSALPAGCQSMPFDRTSPFGCGDGLWTAAVLRRLGVSE